MKDKHVGLYAYRLNPDQGNPREVIFAELWRKENKAFNVLAHLFEDFTDRDAEVAATVIQWLGSNVGNCFLEEARKLCDDAKKVNP